MFRFFRAAPNAQRIIDALPIADIASKNQGPTLLITAGLDGDEYAGIEAAYKAAEKYKDANFIGRLIILPIVNVAGYEQRMSYNPLDKKFPKYCIPGWAHGSPTPRLMHHIVQTYAKDSLLWLDLHSGAQDEIAIPCLWNDVTGTAEVDARGETFTNYSGVHAAVRGAPSKGSRTLAQYGCAYILVESEDENQHMLWIELAMQQLGMISGNLQKIPTRIFQKTRIEKSTSEVQENEVVLWHKVSGMCEIAEDELKG